jgi:hypothetical protein
MKVLFSILLSISIMPSVTVAQGLNKTVFGPLLGDDAGVLTVHNGEAIEIELWVRTDPDNPTQIIGLTHALMSEDVIIAQRNGIDIEPEYSSPPDWEMWWIDGPYIYNPEDNYPIPEDWTCEIQAAICAWNPPGDCLDTEGEWDLYGTWLMDTNVDVPTGQVYFPFSEGWYPHSGQGTYWAFGQPYGGIVPEQDYCGLHFVTDCQYIPGDCNLNGVPSELPDVICMIGLYRGTVSPYITCPCPPHGNEFPLTATVDSNCVVMELEDVVRQICGYRSGCELWGCPDCPGISGILPRDENRQQPIPFLKSKVKDKRESFPE